jgi:lambda family phage portal protein
MRDPYRSPPNRYQSPPAEQRGYEAAKPSRLRTIKRTRSTPDTDGRLGGQAIREAARWLDQNYDLAVGVVDTLVRKVVGTGILPEFLVRTRDGDLAAEFNDEIAELYARWARAPEVTGEHDLAGAQRMKALHLFRDGECFAQYLIGQVPGLVHGSEVPLSLELIPPEFVPIGLTSPTERLIQGVEKDQWGRAVAYRVQTQDPAQTAMHSLILGAGDYRRIPAAQMQHLKLVRNIRQTRGISVFAACLERIEDIRDYDESERVAAKIAASMAAYTRRGTADMFDPNTLERDEYGRIIPREHRFQAGMIFDYLEVGEEIGTINTSRPSSQFGVYRAENLRSVAAGTGASASAVANNYDGTYSSRRQEANEAAVHYAMLWSYFCATSERPICARFIDAAIAARLVRVPADVDLRTLYDIDFSRPVASAIDRQKEAAANETALNSFQESLVDVWRREGRSPADMWRKLADQAIRLQAIQGAAPTRAPAVTPDVTDDEEPDNETEKEDDEEAAA